MTRYSIYISWCAVLTITCKHLIQSKVNILCAEKLEWLGTHEDCSEDEATQQTSDFHVRMQPHLDKLEPPN